MTRLPAILLVALPAACAPPHTHPEIEGLYVSNETDFFLWKARAVHAHEEAMVYAWTNTGERARVHAQQRADPMDCTSGALTVRVTDAEGTVVFERRVDLFDDEDFELTEPSGPGVPGSWTVTIDFDAPEAHRIKVWASREGPSRMSVASSSGSFEWTVASAEDRDTVENHTFENPATQGSVTVDVEARTVVAAASAEPQSSLRTEVFDAEGAKVADCVCSPDQPSVRDLPTLAGQPGRWTVRLTATNLTADEARVTVVER
jgi:hypothetical protein